MRATLVVVRDELGEHAVQVPSVQDEQLVQALPAHRADPVLRLSWLLSSSDLQNAKIETHIAQA